MRGNAALSLVRFGDASGLPADCGVAATGGGARADHRADWSDTPQDSWAEKGRTASVVDTAAPDTSLREGGVVAKLSVAVFVDGTGVVELRSPITGRVRTHRRRNGGSRCIPEIWSQ